MVLPMLGASFNRHGPAALDGPPAAPGVEALHAQPASQDERTIAAAILDTMRALVMVLGPDGRVLRANRACVELTGISADAMTGMHFWDLFVAPEEVARSRRLMRDPHQNARVPEHESEFTTPAGVRHRISWTSTILPGDTKSAAGIVVTGADITEYKRMEQALLVVSEREQRRIGQDLHDGLGQHLTGIAFLGKVLEQKLIADQSSDAAADAAKIVSLVNEAINKTRELSRGLLPVVSDADGLMGALSVMAREVADLYGIPCDFSCPGTVRVTDLGIATHLYLIAREAVNNALRHASPSRLLLTLERDEACVSLSVTDDGTGIAVAALEGRGLGLHIMRFRAQSIGGVLEIRTRTVGGTEVRCRCPADFPTVAR